LSREARVSPPLSAFRAFGARPLPYGTRAKYGRGKEGRRRRDALVAPVNIVAHEEVVCVWRVAADPKELRQVVLCKPAGRRERVSVERRREETWGEELERRDRDWRGGGGGCRERGAKGAPAKGLKSTPFLAQVPRHSIPRT